MMLGKRLWNGPREGLLLLLPFFLGMPPGSLLAAGARAKPPKAAPQAELKLDHAVTVDLKGLKAKVFINEVPLVQMAALSRTGSSVKMNMWLLQGKNTVTLELSKPEPGEIPAVAETAGATDAPGAAGTAGTSGAAGAAGTAGATAPGTSGEAEPDGFKLDYHQRLSGTTEPGKLVFSFVWPESATTKEKLPLRKVFDFEVSAKPRGKFLAGALPLGIDKASSKAVVAAVTKLHKAYSERNIKEIFDLTILRGQEAYEAMYWPPDQLAPKMRTALAEFKLAKVWQVEALQPQDLELKLVARNTMIMVSRKGGGSVIKITTDEPGADVGFERLYYAPYKGSWQMVR